MKVLFIAKHGSGDNDDEGSITYALRQLGHEVTCVHEMRRHREPGTDLVKLSKEHDLALFLKWSVISEIASLKCPRAYWHFDLIDGSYDITLAARSAHRIQWCRDVYPHVILGAHTDGDYVHHWKSFDNDDYLMHLMQGADERYVGFGTPAHRHGFGVPPILFFGMVNHGQQRASHIAELKERYGDQFGVIGDGGPKKRIHGRELADLCASTKIIIAPDGPVTDRYFSNRLFLVSGFGGFLLHPKSYQAYTHYLPGDHLQYYVSRDHLYKLIDYYLDNPAKRETLRHAAFQQTIKANLYRHRVAKLIEECQRRM